MRIAKLRHQVQLCSQKDVVTDGEWHLNREGVVTMWAHIEGKAASMFSPAGATMNESRDKRTHIVVTRYRPDLVITALAWIYEERLQSPPRWFKILKVTQTESKGSYYYKFECRLVERSDDAAEPIDPEDEKFTPVQELPQGVKL